MKPEFAVKYEIPMGEFVLVTIDTNKATWQGKPWKTLGDFGKRKFENMLIILNSKSRLKLFYA